LYEIMLASLDMENMIFVRFAILKYRKRGILPHLVL
jgi:hypothetical protein